MNLQGMEALSPSQDTEDDLVEQRAGHQEEAPVEGALGDFDEASGIGNEPWHSHATLRRISRAGSCTSRRHRRRNSSSYRCYSSSTSPTESGGTLTVRFGVSLVAVEVGYLNANLRRTA